VVSGHFAGEGGGQIVFWSSKPKEKKKILLGVREEPRGAFRVFPSDEEPVTFQFAGKKIKAMDISGGGISFKNDGFRAGYSEVVGFTLPIVDVDIRVKLEVVNIIEAKNLCCCRFVDIDEEQQESVFKYCLERQKEELQKKKK
jgi:hypothetical protein